MAKGVCSVCDKKRPHKKDVEGWTSWVASHGRGKDYVQASFVACPEHKEEAAKALRDFLAEGERHG
jgi:hypothetical protein